MSKKSISNADNLLPGQYEYTNTLIRGGYHMGIKELLIPKDTIFFDLFERQAGLLKEEHLEIATDNCEDVANTLSDIAIRHS